MTQKKPLQSISHINPYKLAAEEHGWRGLTVPGVGKRKCWTVLHNEQVLMTALLILPGERSVRHSHETGELSIYFDSAMSPGIEWVPPGLLHAGVQLVARDEDDLEQVVKEATAKATGDAALGTFLVEMVRRQRQMQEQVTELGKPQPSPTMMIDILFPPFKTTIDDPAYTEKVTVTGQWYD